GIAVDDLDVAVEGGLPDGATGVHDGGPRGGADVVVGERREVDALGPAQEGGAGLAQQAVDAGRQARGGEGHLAVVADQVLVGRGEPADDVGPGRLDL